MKKRNIIILLTIVLGFIVLMPLIIMLLYDLGDLYPIIRTPFTESDMLGFSAAIVGAVVGAAALIYSVVNNTVRFHVSHATTFNNADEECVLIRLCNDSLFECVVQSVCITNEKHNHRIHIIRTGSFTVKARGVKECPVPSEYARKVLKEFEGDKESTKLFYELYMEGGGCVYLKADDLIETLKKQEAHHERYGYISAGE